MFSRCSCVICMHCMQMFQCGILSAFRSVLIENSTLTEILYRKKVFGLFDVFAARQVRTACKYLSRHMGKPTICLGENKGADQLRRYYSAFVFATRIVQFLFYLTPKFQVSSLPLCLYSPVCVGPVRKPHRCFFSTRWLIHICL